MSFRFIPRWAIALLVAIPAVGVGLTISSAAASSPTTVFYACLKGGTLSSVKTAPHACRAGFTSVTWGAAGPQGPKGSPGPSSNTCTTPPAPSLNYSDCDFSSGVDFKYADLQSASFNGAVMPSSDFFYAQLQGANLSGVTATSANFIDTALTDANLFDGSFGYSAFYASNLTGANLRSADFDHTNLGQSLLVHVNFAYANLLGMLSLGATITGDTWFDTICPDGTNSADYTPQTCVGHGM